MGGPRFAVLDGREVRPVADAIAWCEAQADDPDVLPSIVRADTLCAGAVVVSTSFLGFNARPFGLGPPQWFETVILGGARDGEVMRAASFDEADQVHAAAVARVLAAVANA